MGSAGQVEGLGGFAMDVAAGTVGTSGRGPHTPTALEVLAGIDKFVTTDSSRDNGLLARPYSPGRIAVDKRVLSIPASYQALKFIQWAVAYSTDSDESIVSRATKLLRHG